MRRCLLSLLFLFGATAAFAQPVSSGIEKASDGQFTGLLLVTDDLDWYDMFQRPEPPSFEAKEHFGPGEKGSLAIIFSNAAPRDGNVRVLCDITAHDPEGSRQVADDQLCYEGPFYGPNILHPALLDLRFEIGADEPAGRSGFSVTLRDAYSDRAVDLDIAFTQGAAP
ncbi:hypothetical protein D9M68_845210 [compost metagenome]